MKTISGRAFVFGDDINTDVMAPGLYFKSSMEEMARHCLEAVNPDFSRQVRPGDIIVAGRNFGVGSAREQAAMALTHLGVGAVLAVSFGRIFYRNALNFGLPALVFPEASVIGDARELDGPGFACAPDGDDRGGRADALAETAFGKRENLNVTLLAFARTACWPALHRAGLL